MTATVSPPTTSQDRRPASPVRPSLAPAGSAPALLDGAWWPRSRDLTAELPALASTSTTCPATGTLRGTTGHWAGLTVTRVIRPHSGSRTAAWDRAVTEASADLPERA